MKYFLGISRLASRLFAIVFPVFFWTVSFTASAATNMENTYSGRSIVLPASGKTRLSRGPYARDDCGQYGRFCGPYMGIWAGLAQSRGQFSSDSFISPDGNPANINNFGQRSLSQPERNIYKPIFGLVLGGGYPFGERIYLGGELGGSFSKEKIKASTTESNGISSNPEGRVRNAEFTADFTPGVILCNTKVFARVGVAVNRLRLQADPSVNARLFGFEGIVLPLTYLYDTPSEPVTKTRAALRLGVGISQFVSCNLALNFNYTYVDYGKITSSTAVTIPSQQFPATSIRNFTNTTTFRFKRQTFSIGLHYYFP